MTCRNTCVNGRAIARQKRRRVGCPSDLSGDEVTDTSDLLMLLASWGECPRALCPWDFNGDEVVDDLDADILVEHWSDCPDPPEECPWDLNGDGAVNGLDLLILDDHHGPCPAEDECPTDLNGDGYTDTADLLTMLGRGAIARACHARGMSTVTARLMTSTQTSSWSTAATAPTRVKIVRGT